jgi:solute carrier family 35 protein F1/2
MLCYNLALFTMSSLVPIVLQLSSATFLNLSLLTSNFFSLLVGLALSNISIIPEYPIAFSLAILGITTFNMYSHPPTIHLHNHHPYQSISHEN